MNQYIITEEQLSYFHEKLLQVLKDLAEGGYTAGNCLTCIESMSNIVRSHPYQSERDIEQLKKAIIEVLDTGFESSERDLELVMDRIDAWEKGDIKTTTTKWGDGNPRLQVRNPDGTLRQAGEP